MPAAKRSVVCKKDCSEPLQHVCTLLKRCCDGFQKAGFIYLAGKYLLHYRRRSWKKPSGLWLGQARKPCLPQPTALQGYVCEAVGNLSDLAGKGRAGNLPAQDGSHPQPETVQNTFVAEKKTQITSVQSVYVLL